MIQAAWAASRSSAAVYPTSWTPTGSPPTASNGKLKAGTPSQDQ